MLFVDSPAYTGWSSSNDTSDLDVGETDPEPGILRIFPTPMLSRVICAEAHPVTRPTWTLPSPKPLHFIHQLHVFALLACA